MTVRSFVRWPPVIVCFIAFCEAIVYGFTFPYFSLLLDDRGLSASLVGLNAVFGMLGVLVAGPFVPRLIVKYGYRDFSIYALLFGVACFMAMVVFHGTLAIFILRCIMGMALASLWISTEAWLNHIAEDKHRGTMNGVFQLCYAIGFFLGPNLIYLTGTEGALPLVTVSIIALIAAVTTRLIADRHDDVQLEGEQGPITWRVTWEARVLLVIAGLAGMSETALVTMLPIFGQEVGLTREIALAVLVVYTAGEAVCGLPIGWLADRVNRRRLLAATSLTGSICVALMGTLGFLPFTGWIAAFAAGGMMIGLYNIALVILGETYRGTDLPVVATAFSMAYAIGCALGAAFGGITMQLLGPYGLTNSVALLLAVFGLVSVWLFRPLPIRGGGPVAATSAVQAPDR